MLPLDALRRWRHSSEREGSITVEYWSCMLARDCRDVVLSSVRSPGHSLRRNGLVSLDGLEVIALRVPGLVSWRVAVLLSRGLG